MEKRADIYLVFEQGDDSTSKHSEYLSIELKKLAEILGTNICTKTEAGNKRFDFSNFNTEAYSEKMLIDEFFMEKDKEFKKKIRIIVLNNFAAIKFFKKLYNIEKTSDSEIYICDYNERKVVETLFGHTDFDKLYEIFFKNFDKNYFINDEGCENEWEKTLEDLNTLF